MSTEVDAILERARAVRDEVLTHPDHTAGIDRTTFRLLTIERRPGLARLVGALDHHDGCRVDLADWGLANRTVRLVLPTREGDPVSRIYTVRRAWLTGDEPTLEIDIVRHEHPSPAMDWLEDVELGDAVPILGPRAHLVPDSEGCTRAIWLTDATGLPAVHSLLTHRVDGVPVRIVVAVDADAPVDELPAHTDVEIEVAPATPGSLLAALERLTVDTTTSVWAAGERAEMRAVRAMATSAGIDRRRVRAFGYWREGRTATVLDAQRVLFYKARFDRGLGMSGVDDLDIPD